MAHGDNSYFLLSLSLTLSLALSSVNSLAILFGPCLLNHGISPRGARSEAMCGVAHDASCIVGILFSFFLCLGCRGVTGRQAV